MGQWILDRDSGFIPHSATIWNIKYFIQCAFVWGKKHLPNDRERKKTNQKLEESSCFHARFELSSTKYKVPR